MTGIATVAMGGEDAGIFDKIVSSNKVTTTEMVADQTTESRTDAQGLHNQLHVSRSSSSKCKATAR
jgi:hypothetical protein